MHFLVTPDGDEQIGVAEKHQGPMSTMGNEAKNEVCIVPRIGSRNLNCDRDVLGAGSERSLAILDARIVTASVHPP